MLRNGDLTEPFHSNAAILSDWAWEGANRRGISQKKESVIAYFAENKKKDLIIIDLTNIRQKPGKG